MVHNHCAKPKTLSAMECTRNNIPIWCSDLSLCLFVLIDDCMDAGGRATQEQLPNKSAGDTGSIPSFCD